MSSVERVEFDYKFFIVHISFFHQLDLITAPIDHYSLFIAQALRRIDPCGLDGLCSHS
jgi:hypothetical protein